MTGRVVVGCVAVVVLAWLGVMERDSRLQTRGLRAASAGRVVDGQRDLLDARLLNPDASPDLYRGLLYLTIGNPRPGKAILESVVRREPDNRLAWRYLDLITRRDAPAASRRARENVRRLDPIGARTR